MEGGLDDGIDVLPCYSLEVEGSLREGEGEEREREKRRVSSLSSACSCLLCFSRVYWSLVERVLVS